MKQILSQICLSPAVSILEAIECLNRSGMGIVLVCDDEKHLLGTITDADVRKGLANGVQLHETVTAIANLKATTLPEKSGKATMAAKFRESRLRAIPIVNSKMVLLDCVFVEQVVTINSVEKNLVIMAGGFGKRMGELTDETPKPMLIVKGKPIIQHIVEAAVDEQFDRIFISTHYLANQIHDYFGDGKNFGVDISFIHEKKPLGTGGSFALVPVRVGPVVITNADVLSTVGYTKLLDFHRLQDASATMAVHEHSIQHPFGVVKSENLDLIGFDEKPVWVTNVNAGIYVVDAAAKALIEPDEAVSMPEVIQRIKSKNQRVVIFPLHENWTDIGDVKQYEILS